MKRPWGGEWGRGMCKVWEQHTAWPREKSTCAVCSRPTGSRTGWGGGVRGGGWREAPELPGCAGTQGPEHEGLGLHPGALRTMEGC